MSVTDSSAWQYLAVYDNSMTGFASIVQYSPVRDGARQYMTVHMCMAVHDSMTSAWQYMALSGSTRQYVMLLCVEI